MHFIQIILFSLCHDYKQLMEHCKLCVNSLNYKQTGIERQAHQLKSDAKITVFNWYLHKLCKTVDIRRQNEMDIISDIRRQNEMDIISQFILSLLKMEEAL